MFVSTFDNLKFKKMKTNVNVKVATFKEAFDCFLSFIEPEGFTMNTLNVFSELKEKKVVRIDNPTCFWQGNHRSSDSWVELFYIEEPTTFFVVKSHYRDNNENWNNEVKTFVFVV